MPTIRKVFEGVATRHEMYRMFNRHRGEPAYFAGEASHLFAGEWFEIAEREHDYMLELLPPLWMRAEMFALREFMTDDVTSIFFSLFIDGRKRFFHGYCDLSEKGSAQRMRDAIIARESRPLKAMTRAERLEHIWSSTHDDYRGYSGERWAEHLRGKRTVLVYGGRNGTMLKLLDQLTDAEITAKLPAGRHRRRPHGKRLRLGPDVSGHRAPLSRDRRDRGHDVLYLHENAAGRFWRQRDAHHRQRHPLSLHCRRA